MQTDMHYYGTYAMARAAGLRSDICKTIATAAQFVDDNAITDAVHFDDAGRVDFEATAHHTLDIHNVKIGHLNAKDQRQIWVPFHFLPGNQGEGFTERLICRQDSAIAQEMVSHHLSLSGEPFAVELLGITAHVYADTFSHYGFSGVSSRYNRVDNGAFEFDENLDDEMRTYITEKAERFFENYKEIGAGLIENIKSWFAEEASGALGHGGAATFPDRPFLKWSLVFEEPSPRQELRDNHATFLQGCQALHKTFRRFAEKRPDTAEGSGREWDAMADKVAQVLDVQAGKDGRIKAWQEAAGDPTLFGKPEQIPIYDEVPWIRSFAALDGTPHSYEALDNQVYRFYQAASHHRTYVLRNLLPRHGLIVD